MNSGRDEENLFYVFYQTHLAEEAVTKKKATSLALFHFMRGAI